MTDRQQARLQFYAQFARFLLWVAAACVLARLCASATWPQYHLLAGNVVVLAIAAVGGFGGLWRFWHAASAYDEYRLGYRVRWRSRGKYQYEEFGEDGMLRSLTVGYRPLAETYAPPCEIEVPTSEQWESDTPPWAHSRREIILLRLTAWAQHGYGQPVTFVRPSTNARVEA